MNGIETRVLELPARSVEVYCPTEQSLKYVRNWRRGQYGKRLAEFINKVLEATGASLQESLRENKLLKFIYEKTLDKGIKNVLCYKYRRKGMNACKNFKVIHLAPSPPEREEKEEGVFVFLRQRKGGSDGNGIFAFISG